MTLRLGTRRCHLLVALLIAGLGLAGCETLRIRGSGGERGIHDIKIGIPI